MGTKSDFTKSRPKCAKVVTYKGGETQCQREGIHKDSDGERAWCGLHNPGKQKKQLSDDTTPEQSSDESSAADSAQEEPSEEVSAANVERVTETRPVAESAKDNAIKEAISALTKISNMKDLGWQDTDVNKYRAVLAEANRVASDTKKKITKMMNNRQGS